MRGRGLCSYWLTDVTVDRCMWAWPKRLLLIDSLNERASSTSTHHLCCYCLLLHSTEVKIPEVPLSCSLKNSHAFLILRWFWSTPETVWPTLDCCPASDSRPKRFCWRKEWSCCWVRTPRSRLQTGFCSDRVLSGFNGPAVCRRSKSVRPVGATAERDPEEHGGHHRQRREADHRPDHLLRRPAGQLRRLRLQLLWVQLLPPLCRFTSWPLDVSVSYSSLSVRCTEWCLWYSLGLKW